MAKHSKVKDEGAVFVIVPSTRKVTVPTSHYVIGTVGEHLSEQITIECPATIDGHDITACDKRYVTWLSVNGTIGHDELTDMTVNDDVASFKWNVRNGLTSAKGVVSFSIHFEDTEDGETAYKFSTTTCKSCEILDAINAQLGKYEAIYVADETLVFADYTPVADDTLAIETNGIVPEGTLEITANGTYDVGEYALARVGIEYEKPSIAVSKGGLITASTKADTITHQLSATDDPEFIASNIKENATIFGVRGTYDNITATFRNVSGTIGNTCGNYAVLYQHMEKTEDYSNGGYMYYIDLYELPFSPETAGTGMINPYEIREVMLGGLIIVSGFPINRNSGVYYDGFQFDASSSHGVTEVYGELSYHKTYAPVRMFRVTEDDFVLNFTFSG